MDSWRKQDDDFLQKGDAAFVQAYGLRPDGAQLYSGILRNMK